MCLFGCVRVFVRASRLRPRVYVCYFMSVCTCACLTASVCVRVPWVRVCLIVSACVRLLLCICLFDCLIGVMRKRGNEKMCI